MAFGLEKFSGLRLQGISDRKFFFIWQGFNLAGSHLDSHDCKVV